MLALVPLPPSGSHSAVVVVVIYSTSILPPLVSFAVVHHTAVGFSLGTYK